MKINNRVFCIVFIAILFFSQFVWAADNSSVDDIMSELDSEYSDNVTQVHDPIEPINRFMFKVNDKLYFYVFKPVAKAYSEVVPLNFRQGISRAFSNIKYPIRAVNHLLEFEFVNFLKDTARVILNTALGFGGLLDVASGVKALSPPPKADTGLTFAKWGIGNGIYLVLPVLGPTTLRDGIGMVGDHFLDPVTYVEPMPASIAIKGEDRLNYLSLHLGEYEDIKSSAIDPYISFRNAYIQYRDSLLSKH